MKRFTLIALVAVFALFLAAPVLAQEEAAKKEPPGKPDTLKWAEANFEYVGEKKCKMCHKEQFTTWAETKHAKAWESLKPEEQKKEECIGCHSTGVDKSDSLLVGVGCEACHGPGSKYKSKKAMEDPKLAAEAGLVPVTEAMCVRCHNPASPTYKEFKFADALKIGVHAHPAKEEAAPEK